MQLSVAVFALLMALGACVQPTPGETEDVAATVAAQVAGTVEAQTQDAELSEVSSEASGGSQLTLDELQELLAQLTPEPDTGSGAEPTETPTQSPTPKSLPSPTASPTLSPSPTASLTATATPVSTPTPRILAGPSPSPTPDTISNIERAAMAVVFIQIPNGSGSGFVFDNNGHILTNAHVVESFRTVTVRYNDKFNFQGTVVNKDVISDLAVIKVDTRIPLEHLTFGDSSEVRLGQAVNVIGFPFGTTLGSAVSIAEGVLSARREFNGVEYLQTDAAINPGNSGGPLVNKNGEVVGVNTSRLEEVAGRIAQGIGLAVTSNYVQRVLPFLLEETALVPMPTSTRVPTATSTSQIEGDWFVYRNTRHGYSMAVPTDWSLDLSDESAVQISADYILIKVFVYPSGFTDLDELAGAWIESMGSETSYTYVHEDTFPSSDKVGNPAIAVTGRIPATASTCTTYFEALLLLDSAQVYELHFSVCDNAPLSEWSKVNELAQSFGLNVDAVLPTPIPAPTATATPSPTPIPSVTPIPFYELTVELEPPGSGLVFVNPWDDSLLYVSGTLVQLTAQCSTGFAQWFGDKPEYGDPSDETIFMFMDKDQYVLLSCQ